MRQNNLKIIYFFIFQPIHNFLCKQMYKVYNIEAAVLGDPLIEFHDVRHLGDHNSI